MGSQAFVSGFYTGDATSLKNLSIAQTDLPWIDGKCTPALAVAGIIAQIEAAGANWNAGSRVLSLKSADADAVPLQLSAVGTHIVTPGAENLVVDPAGYFQVGTGAAPGHAPTGGFFIGSCEFDNPVHFDDDMALAGGDFTLGTSSRLIASGNNSYIRANDGKQVYFGSANDSDLRYNTIQTPHAVALRPGTDSNGIIFAIQSGTDFARPLQPDATFWFMSGNAHVDITEWASVAHNRTRPVAGSGKGSWSFPAGLLTLCSTADVTNPPTDVELQAAFGGTAVQMGAGFTAWLDDAGGGLNMYVIGSDGTNFWYIAATKVP